MIPMIAIGIKIHKAVTWRILGIERSGDSVATVVAAADDDDDEVSLSVSSIIDRLITLGSVITADVSVLRHSPFRMPPILRLGTLIAQEAEKKN